MIIEDPKVITRQRYYYSNNNKNVLLFTVLSNLLTILLCILFVAVFYNYNNIENESTECVDNRGLEYPNGARLRLNEGKTLLDFESKSFEIRSIDGEQTILRGSIANRINLDNDYKKLVFTKLSHNANLVQFHPKPYRGDEIHLRIRSSKANDDIECNSYEWTSRSSIQDLEVCFDLRDSYWFGQSEAFTQYWPINNVSYGQDYRPYLTGVFDSYSSVIERYWLSSSGVAIVADQGIPLFVLKNTSHFCLLASSKAPYTGRQVYLKYDTCQINKQNSPKDYLNKLHLYTINNYFKKPTGWPDERMIKSPIWSTWAMYKKEINHDIVLRYAEDIVYNNYTNSQLEIDDKWQVHYGDFEFDKEKFPDMKALISKINDLGFRTTLWMFPFINFDSKSFLHVIEKQYAITEPNSTRVSLTKWWDGLLAAMIDFTNKDAADWFVKQLNMIRNETGIDSFKFDAGEFDFVPTYYSLKNAPTTPEQFSMDYAKTAYRVGDAIEIRVGTLTQDIPVFRRMIDKDSQWGLNNGLAAVLTSTLAMSFLGYSYVLPDMIGGNAYVPGVFPEYELFIRWTQLNAFLPSMQFSIPPWFYNNKTDVKVNDICRRYVSIHEDLVYPLIIKNAKITMQTGEPITRSIWWTDNSNDSLFEIYDEFLVGNDILVAPILEKGKLLRDIFLPKGQWKSASGDLYTGPTKLSDFPAPIEDIPYFIRVQ